MATGAGTGSPQLATLVEQYVFEDSYLRAGALIREHPELLGNAAARIVRRLAERGQQSSRTLAVQQLRFLDRCRADSRAAFPADDPTIDPTCYALVADEHGRAEQTEAAFAESPDGVVRARRSKDWADAWVTVISNPALAAAHPALLAALLNDGARAHLCCYLAAGRLPRLRQATSWWERAVALTPPTSSRAATRRNNLAQALLELAEATCDDSGELRARALRLSRDAVAAVNPGTSAWVDCGVGLALAHVRLYWATGQLSHLDRGAAALEPVMDLDVVPVNAAYALGVVLRQRYAARGRPMDLDRAVSLLSSVRDATGPTEPERLRRLLDLGVALLDRHQRDSAEADLHDAAEALQSAAMSGTATSPDWPAVMSHYALCHYRSFESTGSMDSLTLALELARDAAFSPVVRDEERAAWLTNYGAIMEEQARQSANPAMLDAAIAVYSNALDAPLSPVIRWRLLASIGAARRDRFAMVRDPRDLDLAVSQLQASSREVPAGTPDVARVVLALALARFERYSAASLLAVPVEASPESGPGGDPAELLTALEAVRSLSRRRLPRLDRARARSAYLALAIAAAEIGRAPVSREHLRRSVVKMSAQDMQVDPEMLLWTGSVWGRWAMAESRWRDAEFGYRVAVDTLHHLVRLQADRRHGVWWLRSAGQLAGEAAYAAAAARSGPEAVRLMETGRLVLAAEILELQAAALRSGPGALPQHLSQRLGEAVRRVRAAERAAQSPLGAA